MEGGQRRLAAIMFTDMVGYTALTQVDEAHAMELLDKHNRLLRRFFPRFNGTEVKTIGDSFLVEFLSALEALNCAVEIQSFLHNYNLSSSEGWKISLRVAIHLGDVIHKKGDVFGDAVNIASRIEHLAPPEGIVVSEQVYDQVQNKTELPLVSLGATSLKNVRKPVQVYSVKLPWEKESPSKEIEFVARRIAVLPFANMSPDPRDDYFSDGITEELIDRLSQVRGLEVIARTSVMGYKGEKKKASQIAKELGVGSLVEGSVRKAGNRIRVTAQLVNGTTEGHIWSSHYDSDLNDIFAVQSRIAEKVARELKVRLVEDEKRVIEKKPTTNTEAYTDFLQGMQLVDRLEEEPIRAALGLFQKAVSKDRSFARAYAGIARSYYRLGNGGYLDWQEAIEKGRFAAKRALKIDPDLAEAHEAMARIMFMHDDHAESREEARKALKLNPNLAYAYAVLRDISGALGDFPEMLRAAEQAYKLNPISPVEGSFLGRTYFWARREKEALNLWKKTLNIDPYRTYRLLFDYYISKGDYSKAEKTVKELERIGPNLEFTYVNRGYLAGVTGDGDTARKMIDKLVEKHAPWALVGYVYYALGDLDSFFDCMSKAADAHSLPAVVLRYNPMFDKAQKDPRMAEIFRKSGRSFP